MGSKGRRHFEVDGFFEQIHKESDRAAAVLGAATMEYFLELMLKARLHEDTRPTIFDFNGPLGDLSSKIDVAFAVGLLDRDTRDALHILRDIRNDFAHDPDHTLRFDSQSVRDRMGNLPTARFMSETLARLFKAAKATRLEEDAKTARESVESPRARFHLALNVLTQTVIDASDGPRFTSASAPSFERAFGNLLEGV